MYKRIFIISYNCTFYIPNNGFIPFCRIKSIKFKNALIKYTLKSGHMLSVLLQHMYLSQVLKHVTDLDTCVPET